MAAEPREVCCSQLCPETPLYSDSDQGRDSRVLSCGPVICINLHHPRLGELYKMAGVKNVRAGKWEGELWNFDFRI